MRKQGQHIIELGSLEASVEITEQRHEQVVLIVAKILGIYLLGTFGLSGYPVPVNIAATLGIAFIMYNSMQKNDLFSVIIQLFFANQYVFGNDKGGLFNLSALIALLMFSFSKDKAFLKNKSTFGKTSVVMLVILLLFQGLSLLNNEFSAVGAKFAAFGIFLALVILISQVSKVQATTEDFVRFIYVLFFMTGYSLIVGLNQKIGFIPLTSKLLPTWDDIEFQYGLFRCGGTFVNFEAYAEYSLSLVLLVFPGIMSGSFKKYDVKLYYAAIGIVIMSILAILLTVTRSSFFLMPLGFLYIAFFSWRRVRFSSILPFIALLTIAIIANEYFKFIDISSFLERSQDMQVRSLSDLASGNEINRGDIFEYAFKKIGKMNGLMGEGYFTTAADYGMVHFDTPTPEVADYHNLYLGIAVFWGFIGAGAFVSFFLFPLIQGHRLFSRISKMDGIEPDVLMGFNALFVFLLINQYKIIFLREVNYAIVIMMLLVLYKAIISMMKEKLEAEVLE